MPFPLPSSLFNIFAFYCLPLCSIVSVMPGSNVSCGRQYYCGQSVHFILPLQHLKVSETSQNLKVLLLIASNWLKELNPIHRDDERHNIIGGQRKNCGWVGLVREQEGEDGRVWNWGHLLAAKENDFFSKWSSDERTKTKLLLSRRVSRFSVQLNAG